MANTPDVLEIKKDLLPYECTILLAGEQFGLVFNYNATADLFTVDLHKDGELICAGEPIMYGVPLWRDVYKSDTFPAVNIIPHDHSGERNLVTFDNLSETVLLIVDNGNDQENIKSVVPEISAPIGQYAIVKQPKTEYVTNGSVATFGVEAIGAVSYLWQISADGVKWNSINGYTGVSGANTKTMTINPAGSWHATQMYRCVVTFRDGSQMITNQVGVVMIAQCAITKQPTHATGNIGDTVTFTIEADNTTYYAWQYSEDGGVTWTRIKAEGDGSTPLSGSSVEIDVTQENMQRLYRCELRDKSWGAAYSILAQIVAQNN